MDHFGKSAVDVINGPPAGEEGGGGVLVLLNTHTHTHTHTYTHTLTRHNVRHRKQPCCAWCTGTCFYYYRSGGAG